jgi:signal transduction histidine kinase
MRSLLGLPRWRPRDRTIASVVAIVFAFELVSRTPGQSPALLIGCACVLSAPLLMLRRHPAAGALGEAAALVLIAILSNAQPAPNDAIGSLIVCLLSYFCGARASLRTGATAVLALIAASQISIGFSDFPNIEITFLTLVPLWVGHQVGLRNGLVDRLAATARELAEEEDAFSQLSVRRERARIARELHDIVAHHLAVVVVQAGAGRMTTAAFDERAGERLATISVASRQALDDMARLVDVLSDNEHGDTETRWQDLLTSASAGGLTVTTGELPPRLSMPTAVEQTAYRVVREVLTNAIKYAPGAQVQLQLTMTDGRVQIDVLDSGPAQALALGGTGGGLGLAGIRDRVLATGGSFTAAPAARGWRVHASFPTDLPDAPPGVSPPSVYPSGMTLTSPQGATTHELSID